MSKLSVFLVVCFWVCAFDGQAQAQTQQSSTPVPINAPASSTEVMYLRALLEETRMLRQSMQRMMGNTLRIRILGDQLARQQNRVEALSEEITQIKFFISQAQDSRRGEDELQEMETRIRETSDPQERMRLSQDYVAYKRTIERERVALQKEAAEQQTRQMQLENSLRLEQARLAELQSQLDALDQELEKLILETKTRK